MAIGIELNTVQAPEKICADRRHKGNGGHVKFRLQRCSELDLCGFEICLNNNNNNNNTI